MTSPLSLSALADELLGAARLASSGRSAQTLHGGRTHQLRHTVIALVRGRSLGEHATPGEATLQVLSGRVRLSVGTAGSWEMATGDHLDLPHDRHDLEALEDSVVLLTVVVGTHDH